jgi:hypothetical protein
MKQRVFTQPGSKCEILVLSLCFPLLTYERTLIGAVGAAEKCQEQASARTFIAVQECKGPPTEAAQPLS